MPGKGRTTHIHVYACVLQSLHSFLCFLQFAKNKTANGTWYYSVIAPAPFSPLFSFVWIKHTAQNELHYIQNGSAAHPRLKLTETLVQSDKILLESSSTCVENDWRAFTAHIWTVNIYLREINITIIIINNDYKYWNYIQDIALILSNVIAHCAHFLFEICRPKWNSGSSSGCFQLLCIFNKLASFTFAVAAII